MSVRVSRSQGVEREYNVREEKPEPPLRDEAACDKQEELQHEIARVNLK